MENHLLAHPKIKNACIAAMTDPVFGESVCASVVLRGEASLSLDEPKRFLFGRNIARFNLPERLKIVAGFPLSGAGNVLRRELRAMAQRIAAEPMPPQGTAGPGLLPR